MSIEHREIARTPFAVVDVETTGISPRDDRIVEIAIALVKPGEEPRLVLETLVHPGRHVAATEIHGLTDQDVVGAPRFADIAPTVMSALSNRVVASHNVYFELRMLAAELERCGYPADVPCVCTMLLPIVIEPGTPRLSLAQACARHGVPLERAHSAGADALAAAHLLRRYCQAARKKGVRTFEELRRRSVKAYDFLATLELPPAPPPAVMHTTKGLRPRGTGDAPSRARLSGTALYLDAVLDVLADLDVTEEERLQIDAVRRESGIGVDEVRAVHGKVFWGMLARYIEDVRIDAAEVTRLHRLRELLSSLGWAPGDPLYSGTS